MAVDLEVKADLTEATNDIVKGALSNPAKESGKAISTLLGFFNNTILYPMQKYNLYAESKLKDYSVQLENKVSKIPSDKLVEPSVNIIGPTMESLKYNLDEEHIKEMFLNILSSDMNKEKKSSVLPSYIEIVKQLSNEDAKFLKTLYEIQKDTKANSFSLVVVTLKPTIGEGGFVILDKVIIPNENRTITPNPIVLDNLIRLGIIEYIDGKAIAGSQLYDMGFNLIKHNYENIHGAMGTVTYQKAILNINSFGLNFLTVCVDNN